MQLDSVSITSSEQKIAPHLQSHTGNIEISNTTVKLLRRSPNNLPGKSKGIKLDSSEVRVWDGFTLTCPTNFKVDALKNTSAYATVVALNVPDAPLIKAVVYKSLSVDCVSCPNARYTLHGGQYYLPYLMSTDQMKLRAEYGGSIMYILGKHTWPTLTNPECLACPTGNLSLFSMFLKVAKKRVIQTLKINSLLCL